MRTWGLVHVHRHVLEREREKISECGHLGGCQQGPQITCSNTCCYQFRHNYTLGKDGPFRVCQSCLAPRRVGGGGQRGKNPFLLSFQPLPGCFRFVTDSCSTSLSRPSSTWATEKSRTREREPACFAHLRSIELYIHKRNKTKKKIPFLDKKSADPATSQWEVGKSQSFSDLTRHKVFLPDTHTLIASVKSISF